MFDVLLYTVTEDNNYLNKSLSSPLSLPGVLRAETDIINPAIRIEASLEKVRDKNYVWIPAFGRYYFINNIKSITDTICEISAHVDVLMSYREDILSLTGTLSRQENIYNPYMYDEMYPVSQVNVISTVPFPNSSQDEQYVLIVGSQE